MSDSAPAGSRAAVNKPRRAVFVDRDGTITRDVGFTHRVEDLALLEGAVDGLRRMLQMDFRLVIVTNQSGVARGFFSEEQMELFHRGLKKLLQEQGVPLTGIYACPFHPSEGIGRYRQDSPLRKPRPGMLLAAAADHQLDLAGSFMIGDKKSDILAGQAAGCRTILVRTGAAGTGEESLTANPDFVAADLVEAARLIKRSS